MLFSKKCHFCQKSNICICFAKIIGTEKLLLEKRKLNPQSKFLPNWRSNLVNTISKSYHNWAAVEALRQDTHLMTERSCVRIPPVAGLFSSLLYLSAVRPLIGSLTEVQHCRFSYKNVLSCADWGEACLICSDWVKSHSTLNTRQMNTINLLGTT